MGDEFCCALFTLPSAFPAPLAEELDFTCSHPQILQGAALGCPAPGRLSQSSHGHLSLSAVIYTASHES